MDNGAVVVDFDDESKRDVIFASEVARHTAKGLRRLAHLAIASGLSVQNAGPTLEVVCILHNGKPLVQWALGRWVTELRLSPLRALALARDTDRAATEVERRAKWFELREPAALVR
jgi:superfamily II helicase